MNTKSSLFVLCLLLTINLFSQSDDKYAGIRCYTENDFMTPIGVNKDDNYTGGVKFEFITNLADKLFRNKILNPMRWTPVMQSLSFNVTAYTPLNLGDPQIVFTDRPYASYQSWNIGTAYKSKKNRLYYELSFGKMGKNLAGDAQKKIHSEHWFGSTRDIPQGWKYQIAEGGAIAINLRVNLEHQLTGANTNGFQLIKSSWIHEINIGQYMINYMQGLRIYLFNFNHAVPSDEDIPPINPAFTGTNHNSSVKSKWFSAYCFFTPRLKAVIHNTTLTGQLLGKSSVHTISPTDVNRGLLEYDGGVQIRVFFLRLGYSIYGRSREYRNEIKSFHNWGGGYIGFIFSW